MTQEDSSKSKVLLDRIVAMLAKLGQRGYVVVEEYIEYGIKSIDPDPDSDPDENKREQ